MKVKVSEFMDITVYFVKENDLLFFEANYKSEDGLFKGRFSVDTGEIILGNFGPEGQDIMKEWITDIADEFSKKKDSLIQGKAITLTPYDEL